jgi:hypothetical protein
MTYLFIMLTVYYLAGIFATYSSLESGPRRPSENICSIMNG